MVLQLAPFDDKPYTRTPSVNKSLIYSNKSWYELLKVATKFHSDFVSVPTDLYWYVLLYGGNIKPSFPNRGCKLTGSQILRDNNNVETHNTTKYHMFDMKQERH